MGISLQGDNLIFLISQPRAGSTLLQSILGNHPDIYTVPEPWLQLHPFYALRLEGYEAEYNAKWARSAVKDFLKALPDGEETYYEGIRQMQAYLYNCSLEDSGKRFFLDKTPRYYHIIPELYRTFPEANFIILLRNPLASLCSIINTWVKTDWLELQRFRYDLIQAPFLLMEGIKLLDDKKCRVLNYEKFLINPEYEVQKICETLNANYAPEMLLNKQRQVPNHGFGYRDQTAIFSRGKVDSKNIEKWVLSLSNSQLWRFVDEYLCVLGQETIERMGYSYVELRELVDKYQPKDFRMASTLPLEWVLENGSSLVRMTRVLKDRGFPDTSISLAQKIVSIVPIFSILKNRS